LNCTYLAIGITNYPDQFQCSVQSGLFAQLGNSWLNAYRFSYLQMAYARQFGSTMWDSISNNGVYTVTHLVDVLKVHLRTATIMSANTWLNGEPIGTPSTCLYKCSPLKINWTLNVQRKSARKYCMGRPRSICCSVMKRQTVMYSFRCICDATFKPRGFPKGCHNVSFSRNCSLCRHQ
jgi:hypothetical protein